MENCELCLLPGGDVVWSDDDCRIVLVGGLEGIAYPGFCRVIWNSHIAEMSDLPPTSRAHLFRLVLATEQALLKLLKPTKINLASLGNVVPHLHWHVIPRWTDDRNYPRPIWAEPLRADPVRNGPDKISLHTEIVAALAALTALEGEPA